VQLREFVQFHEAAEVSYLKIAAVSVEPPEVLAAFRAGLGARFSFLSDRGLSLTDALGIRETTDKRHGPCTASSMAGT
jgi:peroxiredoxin